MRGKKTIFLSYRRDDIPGYVRQLQEDLQRHFGADKVFRDVEDIPGGQQWKEVLSNSLAQSAALIVVIGPRWEQIWRERADKSSDYIVYELNKARDIGIPIIPVTINGTVLSQDLDLGSVAWLTDKQHYDISDRQGRWPTDVLGLVSILEREKGLKRKKLKTESGGKKKYLLIPLIIAALGFFGFMPEESMPPIGAADPIMPTTQPVVSTPMALPSPVDSTEQHSISPFPDITGVWHDDEGAIYEVGQIMADGSFLIQSEYALGVGQFIPEMPGKFALQAEELGYGEYSVNSGNKKMMGWFYYTATDETHYGSLWRSDSP